MLNDKKFVEVALRDIVIELKVWLLVVTCLNRSWFGPIQDDEVIQKALHTVPHPLYTFCCTNYYKRNYTTLSIGV